MYLLSAHHYLDGGVKCLSPQNTSAVSEGNFLAAGSNTIGVNSDRDFRCNKTTETTSHASILLVWCHPSVQQAPTFIFDSKEGHLHRVFSLNYPFKSVYLE